jgi:hypothetical protein
MDRAGQITGRKSFKHKILPVTYCAPKITLQNHANTMIPIDQGGGGTPRFFPKIDTSQDRDARIAQ